MTFQTIKTYGSDIGLSCCFRQWRAKSHCSKLHGYAIGVELTFEAEELDGTNWVIDFGGLKEVKEFLQATFDHKLIVAEDDPHLDLLQGLDDLGVADIVVLPQVGCEAFARHISLSVWRWLTNKGHTPRVSLKSVVVREHGANAASYGWRDR